MPPVVYLDLPPVQAAPPPAVPICELMRNDRVVYEERVYVVRGFDPIGVVDPLVYLEDAGTGDRRIAALTDLLEHGRPHGHAAAAS